MLDSTEASGSSVDGLKATVENAVAQLKKDGLLSGETVGQIFSSVSNKLNGQSDESKKADRQKVDTYVHYESIVFKKATIAPKHSWVSTQVQQTTPNQA